MSQRIKANLIRLKPQGQDFEKLSIASDNYFWDFTR